MTWRLREFDVEGPGIAINGNFSPYRDNFARGTVLINYVLVFVSVPAIIPRKLTKVPSIDS